MTVRDPFAAREVTSRRGGPSKAPLSLDAIVEAAFELLKRDGLDGMTLRKVALALETGAASLYAYVENLEELEALVCDRALQDVKTEGKAKKEWRARFDALVESYVGVLIATPGAAQLALKTIAVGPNGLRILDALLGLFDEAGCDRVTGAWAADLVQLYATSIAAEQTTRSKEHDPVDRALQMLARVTPAQHPHIHAAKDALSAHGRFQWALDALIAGILATPAKPKKKKS